MCVVSLDPHQSLLRCPSSAWSLLILQLLAGEGRGWSRWLGQSLVTPQPSASEPVDPELHVLPLALLQSELLLPTGVPGRIPGSQFHSFPSRFFPKRDSSISRRVLGQGTLPFVGKGTTCRWLPPEA